MCRDQLNQKQKCLHWLLMLFVANVLSQGWQWTIPHKQYSIKVAKIIVWWNISTREKFVMHKFKLTLAFVRDKNNFYAAGKKTLVKHGLL